VYEVVGALAKRFLVISMR